MTQSETDIVIVGGGHAGCEAALAAARLGLRTILFAISLDSIAMMPCNPSIGGSSKGHLVRELDALGGEMGKVIDHTYLQSKLLNTGKGPAVHSLRAQADKLQYQTRMKHTLENTKNLRIVQAEIVDIMTEGGHVTGVKTATGREYTCRAVVICAGTYLQARCLVGETVTHSGPNNLLPATHLSDSLRRLGIRLYRFKTGTPARVNRNSLDFTKMQEQYGDEKILPFSFSHTPEEIAREQVSCWLTYTTEETHEIIRQNLHRSPMFSGLIEGTGARYCPSIEDKVVRFADKPRHQLFIEPEGEYTEEMYIQGMSSSLPEDVQLAVYQSIPGLEHCEIMRNAYAIEYDCIDATQLSLSLEFQDIGGLFGAGQFNGSSGYEEAAAQGLIAGINAAMHVLEREPLILKRSDAYIGVLIDDLVTKGSQEPYRMLTSRAEYRLLLRQDNADLRLRQKGYDVGLVPEDTYQAFMQKKEQIDSEIRRVQKVMIPPKEETQTLLAEYNSTAIQSGVSLADLMRRPELSYEKLAPLDPMRPELPQPVQEQVNIEIKYEGYIRQQERQVEQFIKLEERLLPDEIDYAAVSGLRIEARQKLASIRPHSVGHASRIAGVSPADVAVLLIHLQTLKA